MEWYYVRDGQQTGPVGEPEFEFLVNNGAIGPTTLVWNETMTGWQAYGELFQSGAVSVNLPPPAADQPAPGLQNTCVECGRTFNNEDMIQYGQSWVCASCKPVFFQRLKEGAPIRGTMRYGGFWIRVLAYILDTVVLSVVVISLILAMSIFEKRTVPGQVSGLMGLMMLIFMAIPFVYFTLMHGKYGATIGKMACGLVLVTPDGSKISYMRAFARIWAMWASSMIVYIGFIMAGFDEEKRTLHDRICNTRVVYKSSLVA